MKYLIMNADETLGEKVAQWLMQMTEVGNIRVGISDSGKRDFFKKLKIDTVLVDYEANDSIKKAMDQTNVIVYIPKQEDLSTSIAHFERILENVQQIQATLIFVSFFADQEANPYLLSPFYGYALRRLAGSDIKYTVIKNSLFADPLIPALSQIIKDKEISYPVKDQSVSFITQNDSAHAIAACCMLKMMHGHGEKYVLTMEQNYNMVELAYLMTRATEKSIGYNPLSSAKFIEKNPHDKLEASLYQAARLGELDQVTNDFRKLTGREPEELEHFLRNGYQISKLHALNL
ncbi:3-beta hydroxysteroid dehydrogenase [Lactobacillus hominis]|uniref:Predicted nucleoside-diphosphate-sugar epimerase n=1 Tax=Lactobacillus hominis DSM 23910 = CRBIP 24.179 TaxID=1423758 RepID=I7JUC4_9LACO|nr:3-beta hydroxysteroid dehydrogenase [Lactobacillus hominis]CCI81206.1 Predicted nucleoside-diphosphate-sugar epimerase [Lactobacillus hominis DSM 23910 = CRBIP 24.179]